MSDPANLIGRRATYTHEGATLEGIIRCVDVYSGELGELYAILGVTDATGRVHFRRNREVIVLDFVAPPPPPAT